LIDRAVCAAPADRAAGAAPADRAAGAAPGLAIVIPALNAAETLPATLAALGEARAHFAIEIVVADGGSADATRARAEAGGARVVAAPRGRGPQLAAGAAAAESPWLLFLHADTRLDAGWSGAVCAYLARPEASARAAYFRLVLDDRSPGARRIERLARFRVRRFALPYGDQGLLIARALYDAVGGYRPLPLMEDVDLVRRLGRARLVALDACAVTSAARYARGGFWLRPLRNLFCLALYLAGVPPRLIARLYG